MAVEVVFPTPPFPEVTTIMRLMGVLSWLTVININDRYMGNKCDRMIADSLAISNSNSITGCHH
ncbi:hypothetical protein SPLC1_S010720 [Arthrospira platensis C1]|nr:hypothetical protein SPLC1_S010720 [Arthrospira platensis C1]